MNKTLTEIDYTIKLCAYFRLGAGVVELVDARDSKSREGNLVSVRFRPPASIFSRTYSHPVFRFQPRLGCGKLPVLPSQCHMSVTQKWLITAQDYTT